MDADTRHIRGKSVRLIEQLGLVDGLCVMTSRGKVVKRKKKSGKQGGRLRARGMLLATRNMVNDGHW